MMHFVLHSCTEYQRHGKQISIKVIFKLFFKHWSNCLLITNKKKWRSNSSSKRHQTVLFFISSLKFIFLIQWFIDLLAAVMNHWIIKTQNLNKLNCLLPNRTTVMRNNKYIAVSEWQTEFKLSLYSKVITFRFNPLYDTYNAKLWITEKCQN